MTICVQVYMWAYVSILLGIYLGVELLGYVVTLSVLFWGTARLFSKVAAPFYILTSNAWVQISPHSHQHLLSFLF